MAHIKPPRPDASKAPATLPRVFRMAGLSVGKQPAGCQGPRPSGLPHSASLSGRVASEDVETPEGREGFLGLSRVKHNVVFTLQTRSSFVSLPR